METLIKRHLYDNIRCYILLVLFLVLGAVLGSWSSYNYDEATVEYMTEFFDTAVKIIKTSSPDLNLVFKTAFSNSFKNALFVWILGFTVIGTAVILLIILKCGFMLGFITGFLIRIYSYKGIGAGLIIILSQCLIYIPAMLYISCMAAQFSGTLLRMITGKIKYKTNFKYYILKYIISFLAIILVLVLYSLLESYGGANLLMLYFK